MNHILQSIKKCQRKEYGITNICILTDVDPKPLGSDSSFGTVYIATCGNESKYILKVIPLRSESTAYPLTEKDIQTEVTMQKAFYEKGLAPKIMDAFSCDNIAYIIMEKMSVDMYTLIEKIFLSQAPEEFKVGCFSFIYSKAISLIDQAHIKGLIHGDPHLQNIMLNPPSVFETFLDLFSLNKTIDSDEDAVKILDTIQSKLKRDQKLTLEEKLYLFTLKLGNGEEEDLDATDIEEMKDSLAQDLIMFFGEPSYKILTSFFIENPNHLGQLIGIKSAKFIDFGQSSFIKNSDDVSSDWSKLGGGKYKTKLLKMVPECKAILDLFLLVAQQT